ncbi:hypothetical protein LJB42_002042 [Komagataella kurtzmanii]|nr:hypothetical protein LJB42_002042 [Komagataella kurtzmanii]
MRVIGQGFTSTVYLNEEGNVQKKVDLDYIVAPHDPRRELELLKKLDHPNIIKLLEWGTNSDELVLTFCYYEKDLYGVMKSNTRTRFDIHSLQKTDRNQLPSESALTIVSGLCQALRYLHTEMNIIHRDINPRNIMFKKDSPEPVLIDFGISIEESRLDGICDIGTSCYRAPETLLGLPYSYGVDLWCLAVVLMLIYSPDSGELLLKLHNERDGNRVGDRLGDLALLANIFETFGTPSVEQWPDSSQSEAFVHMNFVQHPGRPVEQLLPRCDDARVKTIFEHLTVYQSSSRWDINTVVNELEKKA